MVKGVAHVADVGKDALRDGKLYSENWKAGVKADIGFKVVISLTLGERSSGNSDNDAMAVFTKPKGGSWEFKEGSVALELSLTLEAYANATVGYVATEGYFSFTAGGVSKVSIQLKVETEGSGARAVKVYFHFNGLKVYYSIEKTSGFEQSGDKMSSQQRGRKLSDAHKNTTTNSGSSAGGHRNEVELIDPWSSNGLELFSFGGRGNG